MLGARDGSGLDRLPKRLKVLVQMAPAIVNWASPASLVPTVNRAIAQSLVLIELLTVLRSEECTQSMSTFTSALSNSTKEPHCFIHNPFICCRRCHLQCPFHPYSPQDKCTVENTQHCCTWYSSSQNG